MQCQRCGYCCIALPVVIIVKEEGELVACSKPAGLKCPHLERVEGGYGCKVHEEPWYKITPCFIYQNSDIDPDFFSRKGEPCRVGPYTMSKRLSFPTEPNAKLMRLEKVSFQQGYFMEKK